MFFCPSRGKDGNLIWSFLRLAFPNLNPPTYMEYRRNESAGMTIRLFGADAGGSFTFGKWESNTKEDDRFVEFPLLPLDKIQTLRLKHGTMCPRFLLSPKALPFSSFPALETFVIEGERDVSCLLSDLFSNPSPSRSLKTLAFLDCNINGEFMDKLTQFSNTKKTTSAPLHRVVIVDSGGKLPSSPTVCELMKYVEVVEAHVDEDLMLDLKWNAPWTDGVPKVFPHVQVI